MKILVINAGSSSIKYRVIQMPDGQLLCKGLLERIGIDGTRLTHSRGDREFRFDCPVVKNHHDGVEILLKKITDGDVGVIESLDEIGAVGHRTVHGGEHFASSVLITSEVTSKMRECIPLAPLHNPANLDGIDATLSLMPDTPQAAIFDTSFHQTMPPEAYIYPLPYDLYEKYRVRRYGFHGTSHRYVLRKGCEFLGLEYVRAKVITCHLGNGSSVAAVKDGRSIDTSMGFTPLEGLVMGTRCGDIDPSIPKFVMEHEGMGISELDSLLNRQSGLLGISGLSPDVRDLLTASDEGNERAKLAIDIFCYRLKKYIGAYAAALGGLDILIFTAGIGENNPVLRSITCSGLEFIGIEIDEMRNESRGELKTISKDTSRVKVLVVPTDEEFVIASDAYELVKNLKDDDLA